MNTGFTIRPIDHPSGGPDDQRKPPSHYGAAHNTPSRIQMVWPMARRVGTRIATTLQRWGWKSFVVRSFLAFFALLTVYLLFLWFTLPSISEETILAASQSTVITDRNGIELYRVFGEQDRTLIPGADIPRSTKEAIIAIEDRRFYERGCIDFRALARAIFSFGNSGGASTITRQLARNALNLQQENIVSRKLKEFVLGCQLESRYDKERLLELYLNWIPFGQNAYGVEQASSRYFGKSAKELTLAESAVLVSLPQRPSYFSPYGRHVHTTVSERVRKEILDGTITTTAQIDDEDVSIGLLGATVGSGSLVEGAPVNGGQSLYVGGRADQVLRSMQDAGFITDEERLKAVEDLRTLEFTQSREDIRAPHFVLWIKEQIETLTGSAGVSDVLERGGITVQTTLDWRLQEVAEQIIATRKDDIAKRFMAENIALVALDPATREILAYVGNTDYTGDTQEGKIDMVQVPRQPGSSFKPFIYAAAFSNGYGPATVLYDVPTKFGDYAPQNFEGSFWGLTNARKALAGSRNIPAVKAYFLGGQENEILSLVDKLGAPSAKAHKPDQGYGASLAIGTAEVPLIEMAQGYATLASLGTVAPVTGILKVTDSRGALLLSQDNAGESPALAQGEQVLDPRVAYEVTSILSDAAARPNEYWRSILSVPGTESAAKTGTSNKCLEWDEKKINCLKRKPDNVWTLGYTPTLVAGVWVGNATSEALSDKADGLTVAAPIWKDFMTKAQKIRKPAMTTFTIPEGITQAQISLLSGELPTECTPVALRKSDIFLAENAPSKDDPACVRLMVDRVTGLLASDSCPAEAREERSFLTPYNAAGASFPQWDTSVINWARAQAMENPQATSAALLAAGTGGTLSRAATLFLAGSGGILPLPLAPTEKCDISMTPGRTVQPTLNITSPEQNGTVTYPSFIPKIQYTVGSRVHNIEYAIDGKIVTTVTSAPFVPALRVPKTIDKNGTHRLRVTLTDHYFNVVSDEVNLTFSQDQSGPSIRLTEPQPSAQVTASAPLTMRAESDDTEGGVKYVEFYVDTVLITRKPSAPYEITYPANLSPGSHTIRAVATDLAGNTAEDEVTITVQ